MLWWNHHCINLSSKYQSYITIYVFAILVLPLHIFLIKENLWTRVFADRWERISLTKMDEKTRSAVTWWRNGWMYRIHGVEDTSTPGDRKGTLDEHCVFILTANLVLLRSQIRHFVPLHRLTSFVFNYEYFLLSKLHFNIPCFGYFFTAKFWIVT